MPFRFGRTARMLAIAAAMAASALILTVYAASGPAVTADEQCMDGRAPCPHEACVSACWADGTVHNHGTKVKNTPFAPIECPPGGGCITQSCN